MDKETKHVFYFIGGTALLLLGSLYSFILINTDNPKCDGEGYMLIYRTHYPDGEQRTDTIRNICECVYASSSFGTNHIEYYRHKEANWLFSTHDKQVVSSTAALEIVSVEKL